MFNQKGQIHIIILAVLVFGFILYTNFSGKPMFQSSSTKSTPKQETKISAPTTKKETSPQLTPGPAPSVPDTTPPKRLNPQPKDKSNLPTDTRKTTLGLETDEKAICRYGDVAGVSYDSMRGSFDQTNAASHSVLITTLSEGEKYKYYIRCMDEKGNKNIDDFVISFGVKLPEDKTPPVLSNPSHFGDVLPKDTKEVVISITTNEVTSCRYSTIGGVSYNSMPGRFSYYDQTKRFHTKKLTGLENGKAYDYFVRCQDSAKNSNTGDVLISFSVANL